MASNEPQTTPSLERVVRADPNLGISSLPEMYVKRRNGYRFNVMLLGPTGVGKTTLIDTLFRRLFKDNSFRDHCSPKVEVMEELYELHECGVDLRLGVVEIQGFGDQMEIGIDESYKPIVEYIETQFDNCLEDESNVCRTERMDDNRVHLCLYLISPIGHGLKAIDLATIKALDKKVNLIPVIAKSDLINKSDLTKLKDRIMKELDKNGINIYRFPIDDEMTADLNAKCNSLLPLATVASNDFMAIDNVICRTRIHPWGTIKVDNEKHSDLVFLRSGIMSNMADLLEKTEQHYERYRETKILEMQTLELNLKEQRRLHKEKERQLIERFTNKLKNKDDELKNREKSLQNMFEEMSKERIGEKMKLNAMQKQLEEDIALLELWGGFQELGRVGN